MTFEEIWEEKGFDKTLSIDGKELTAFKEIAEIFFKAGQQTLMPNWDNAPTGANWVAMDENYSWYWYSEQPYKHDKEKIWGCEKMIPNIEYPCECKDWQSMIFKRPDKC